jgi:hypothetical protein
VPNPVIKEWGKGLNRDQLPYELAPGFWSDVQNYRFRNGLAERCAGIADVGTPLITPYWMCAYPSGATRYLIYAGTTKAYSFDGTTHTEITRTTSVTPVTISTITRTANVATVTTATNHGMSTGFVVDMNDQDPASYRTSSSGVSITVTGATTFTYASSGTNGSASDVGTYVILTGSSTVNFTGAQDDKWTGGNFNGVIVMNNPINGPFYWDQAGIGTLRAFAGTPYTSDVMRPFKYYLVQLAPTISSVKYRHTVTWSTAAEPGSVPLEFIASSTNQAGVVEIVSDGEMVECLEWGEDLIVYKRDIRARLRYIGGNDVFDVDQISVYSEDDGLLAANCIANTPAGQVFLTNNRDIRIHQGGESRSIAEGRIRDHFRANISTTNYARSFLCVNPLKSEVWVCYPATGQSSCNKAYIWNWLDDTWGERDLSTGVNFGCAGLLPTSISTDSRMVICNTTPKIGLVDSGTTDFSVAFTSMLERTGMDMGEPDAYKTLHQSRPQFNGTTAFTASIYHGSSATPDGTVTYSSAVTYTHNTTQRASAFANSGRYLAWKMTTQAAEAPTLRSIQFFINVDGTD